MDISPSKYRILSGSEPISHTQYRRLCNGCKTCKKTRPVENRIAVEVIIAASSTPVGTGEGLIVWGAQNTIVQEVRDLLVSESANQ